MTRFGPCLCGAIDCPSCGPAQGYEVTRVWNTRLNRYVWVNPEPEEPPPPPFEFTADPGTRLRRAVSLDRVGSLSQALIDAAYCLDAPEWLPTPDVEFCPVDGPDSAYISNVFLFRG